MTNTLYYKTLYDTAKWHCEEKIRVKVVEDYNLPDQIILNEKIITINSRQKYENMLYSLLHEIGHYLLYRGKHYNLIYEKKYTPMKNDVLQLGEEYAAWDKGLLLAEKLGLNINRKNFDDLKIKTLKGWIKNI